MELTCSRMTIPKAVVTLRLMPFQMFHLVNLQSLKQEPKGEVCCPILSKLILILPTLIRRIFPWLLPHTLWNLWSLHRLCPLGLLLLNS